MHVYEGRNPAAPAIPLITICASEFSINFKTPSIPRYSINTVRTAASLGGFSYRAGKFGYNKGKAAYNKVTGQGDNNVKGKGGKSDG